MLFPFTGTLSVSTRSSIAAATKVAPFAFSNAIAPAPVGSPTPTFVIGVGTGILPSNPVKVPFEYCKKNLTFVNC